MARGVAGMVLDPHGFPDTSHPTAPTQLCTAPGKPGEAGDVMNKTAARKSDEDTGQLWGTSALDISGRHPF